MILRHLKPIFVFVLVLTAVAACSKKKPQIPTYIRIDSFSFQTNASLPANVATTHDVQYILIYLDGGYSGVYKLPANIPVSIDDKYKEMIVKPGVVATGLTHLGGGYPFYNADTLVLAADPGKTATYTPVTSYTSNSLFRIISNFDTVGGINATFQLASGTARLQNNGLNNGIISLHLPADTLSEDSSVANIQVGNRYAFIEFDYKTDIPFSVGLGADTGHGSNFKYYFRSIDTVSHWQKYYLSVYDFAGKFPADHYKLYFKAALPSGLSSGAVLIDNIQMVYLN